MPSFGYVDHHGCERPRRCRWRPLSLLGIVFGTPGRDGRQVARAQTSRSVPQPLPASAAPRSQAAGAQPFPVPEELRGLDLSRQTAETAAAKSAGCLTCHQGQHDPAFQAGNRPAGLRRLPRRRCRNDRPAARPRLAAVSRCLAKLGQPGPVIHALEPRKPGFHSLREPRRLAGCALELRHDELPRGPGPASAQKHDDPWLHALGGRALQQRLGSVQTCALRRELQHEWFTAAASDRSSADAFEVEHKGVVPFLDPLPRFEASQPGNVLRIFERGRREPQEIGIPNPLEDPGKPRAGLSARGLGTRNRTDPVFVGLQKTRLFDPTLNFLGTNDHPGDYRSSGCTACHVIYANDRSKVNSGPYAAFGHLGLSFQSDPTIPRNEPGPPDQTSVHTRHSDQPVHRLPHPPRHECAQFIHRLHVVG